MSIAAVVPFTPYVGLMSRGASSSADFVAKQYQSGRQELQKSFTFGQLSANNSFNELDQIYFECQYADWDGYGAMPVSEDVFELAYHFLDALPLGTPSPSLGAEPDGHVTLEWHKSPSRTLSVSVSPDGDLHYAASIGLGNQYGTEPFYGIVPRAIMDSIQRVAGA